MFLKADENVLILSSRNYKTLFREELEFTVNPSPPNLSKLIKTGQAVWVLKSA